MDVPLWTLDINVIVLGLLSPDGPPGRLVDAALARRLRFALDDRIVREYRSVLARPKFGFKTADLSVFFGILAHQQHLAVAPSESLELRADTGWNHDPFCRPDFWWCHAVARLRSGRAVAQQGQIPASGK